MHPSVHTFLTSLTLTQLGQVSCYRGPSLLPLEPTRPVIADHVHSNHGQHSPACKIASETSLQHTHVESLEL